MKELGMSVQGRGANRWHLGRAWGSLLHAFGTPSPVAVVEVHLPALQDESSDPILQHVNGSVMVPAGLARLTWPTETLVNGLIVIVACQKTWRREI